MSSTVLILAGSRGAAPKPQSMGIRLSENFFQRWVWILLPIAIMGSIGALMAQRVTADFRASATIDASQNTIIGDRPEIGGFSATFLESTSQATARVMNERLRTDRFVAGVAERAGLKEAVDNGFLGYGDIRARVGAIPTGDSLIDVEATWSDPDTALRLIDATIAQYLSVLESSGTVDAQAAVDFFANQQAGASILLEEALKDLNDFTSALSPDAEQQESEALRGDRLNQRVIDAQSAVDQADAAMNNARATLEGARRNALGSIEVIDPSDSTFLPESTIMAKLVLFGAFLFLGFLIATTILLLSTFLDRSVRSAADIEAAGGGVTVAAVPTIRSLQPQKGLRRARGGAGRVLERVRRAA